MSDNIKKNTKIFTVYRITYLLLVLDQCFARELNTVPGRHPRGLEDLRPCGPCNACKCTDGGEQILCSGKETCPPGTEEHEMVGFPRIVLQQIRGQTVPRAIQGIGSFNALARRKPKNRRRGKIGMWKEDNAYGENKRFSAENKNNMHEEELWE